MNQRSKVVVLAVCVVGALAAGAYFMNNKIAQASDAGETEQAAQKAMPVTVDIVEKQAVQIWNEYSARISAVDFAQIRPQVTGTITEVRFEDGQDVKVDDILYVIDPRPYEAAVNEAQAQLNVAKSQSSLTWKELKRAKELIKTNAISKRILDERGSSHSVSVASIKAAEAALESAKINLDYAYVKAPISGRVSRDEIRVGNLVSAGANAPLLTTIVSTDNVYADFEVDERSYLRYIRNYAKDRASESKVPVKLTLGGDGSEYDGFVDSFDNQIDPTSGTIRARALFANADGALLPGMFASVKMGTPESDEQILIDERAIGTDQDRKFVYIVNDKNIVEYREVKIGESSGGKRIVLSGLNASDKVITEGIIRIRPGAFVEPKEPDAAKAE